MLILVNAQSLSVAYLIFITLPASRGALPRLKVD